MRGDACHKQMHGEAVFLFSKPKNTRFYDNLTLQKLACFILADVKDLTDA